MFKLKYKIIEAIYNYKSFVKKNFTNAFLLLTSTLVNL